MRDLHGVYAPVPTPFRGDEVATERLQTNLLAATGTNSTLQTIRSRRVSCRRDSANPEQSKVNSRRGGQ